jgi:hypothetical protein
MSKAARVAATPNVTINGIETFELAWAEPQLGQILRRQVTDNRQLVVVSDASSLKQLDGVFRTVCSHGVEGVLNARWTVESNESATLHCYPLDQMQRVQQIRLFPMSQCATNSPQGLHSRQFA